jgi:hypothetical protein
MAMIRVQCPKSNCRTITEVDEIYIGRTARCRKCGTNFEIKRPTPKPEPKPAASPSPAAQVKADSAPAETPMQKEPVVAEKPTAQKEEPNAEEHPLAVKEPISQELASVPKIVSEVPAPVLDVEAVVHSRSRKSSPPEPPSPPPSGNEMVDAISDVTRKRQRRPRKPKTKETPGENETGEVTE